MLADTGSLEAAERDMRLVVHGRAVDVAIAGVEAIDDGEPTALVARHYPGRKPIFGIVGNLDRLIVGTERDHRHHRTEGLVLVELHIRRHPGKNRWLHKAALD